MKLSVLPITFGLSLNSELVNDRRECDGRVSDQLSLGVNCQLCH
jgi:hypothetical protein